MGKNHGWKFAQRYWPVWLSLSVVSALIGVTGMVSWTQGFSADLTHRAQTYALLDGRFQLRSTPFGHLHDWVWGNGLQQCWGLGIPLIRLPFDALANLFGILFPDRWIFLGLCFLSMMLLFRLPQTWGKPSGVSSRAYYFCLAVALSVLTLLHPSFIKLLSIRMGVYEEVVAYGVVWNLVTLSLLVFFFYSKKPLLWWLLAFLAGFSASIRPTAILVSGTSFLFALVLALKFRWGARRLVFGILLFVAPLLFVLISNEIRFGSFFEFGYSLNLSSVYANDYALRFGYPYSQVSFSAAARELLGALFFVKDQTQAVASDFYKPDLFPGVSSTVRFREFPFQPFSALDLLLLSFGWAVGALSFFSKSFDQVPLIRGLSAWSFMSFLLLFAFYLYSPSIASRYMVDFLPSLAVGILVGCLFLLGMPLRSFMSKSLLGLAVLLIVGFYLDEDFTHARPQGTSAVGLEESRSARALASDMPSPPELPPAYQCQVHPGSMNLSANVHGFSFEGLCTVESHTTFFFDSPECVQIAVESRRLDKDIDVEANAIRVKRGLEFLERQIFEVRGNHARLAFCAKEASARIEMISVAWVLPERLPRRPDFKLLSIEKISRDKVVGN